MDGLWQALAMHIDQPTERDAFLRQRPDQQALESLLFRAIAGVLRLAATHSHCRRHLCAKAFKAGSRQWRARDAGNGQRIDGRAVVQDFEMKVGAGRASSAADEADQLTLPDPGASSDTEAYPKGGRRLSRQHGHGRCAASSRIRH